MFCRFCGSELPDDAVFCSNCGARIVSQHQAANQQQPEYQQPGYQQQGYQQQPGNAGANTRSPKKKGGIGKFALTAAAGVAGVALAANVMGGFGNLPGGSGTSAAYETTARPGSGKNHDTGSGKDSGTGGSGKDSGTGGGGKDSGTGNGGKDSGTGSGGANEQKKADPISGGRIVAVNKPLVILGETGNYNYQLISGIDQYGKDVGKHMETPPFNNEITIDGDQITVKLPMVAGFKFKADAGTEMIDLFFFRDEITLHGTITDNGQAREGDGYMGGETSQRRQLYYASGHFTRIESILPDGAFSSKWEEPNTDTHEHDTMRGMGVNRRDGKTEEFSKFVLNYYPDDGFYQMFIGLYGDVEEERYYPHWDQDEYERNITKKYPRGEYDIVLTSDLDARMGGPKDGMDWY